MQCSSTFNQYPSIALSTDLLPTSTNQKKNSLERPGEEWHNSGPINPLSLHPTSTALILSPILPLPVHCAGWRSTTQLTSLIAHKYQQYWTRNLCGRTLQRSRACSIYGRLPSRERSKPALPGVEYIHKFHVLELQFYGTNCLRQEAT